MQMEARIQACPSSMSDEVARRLPRPQVLVALADRVVFRAAVVAIGHENRDLGAQLRQLKRAWTALVGLGLQDSGARTCTHRQLR